MLSIGEFFRRYDAMILDQVTLWHRGVSRQALAKALRNMHFVADTCGLVLRDLDEKRAISGIRVMLALCPAAQEKVEKFY